MPKTATRRPLFSAARGISAGKALCDASDPVGGEEACAFHN